MKKIKIVSLIASSFLLLGCAQTRFVQVGKTITERNRALMICDYEAEKATMYIRSPFEAAYRHVEIRNRCMMINGYSLEDVR